MTSPTAETQAKLIVENLRGRQDGWFWAEHAIASAIRQAEDAAYERAAAIADHRYSQEMTFAVALEKRDTAAGAQCIAGSAVASLIREGILHLKHPKEPMTP